MDTHKTTDAQNNEATQNYEAQNYEAENQELRIAISKCQQQNEILKAVIEKNDSEMEDLQRKIVHLKTENDFARGKIDGLEYALNCKR